MSTPEAGIESVANGSNQPNMRSRPRGLPSSRSRSALEWLCGNAAHGFTDFESHLGNSFVHSRFDARRTRLGADCFCFRPPCESKHSMRWVSTRCSLSAPTCHSSRSCTGIQSESYCDCGISRKEATRRLTWTEWNFNFHLRIKSKRSKHPQRCPFELVRHPWRKKPIDMPGSSRGAAKRVPLPVQLFFGLRDCVPEDSIHLEAASIDRV